MNAVDHAALAADLPFYANGTLDHERTVAIEAELSSCERCAAELGEIRALRSSLLAADRDSLAGGIDSTTSLDAMWARIDAREATPAAGHFPARRLLVFAPIAAVLLLAIVNFRTIFPVASPPRSPGGAATSVPAPGYPQPAEPEAPARKRLMLKTQAPPPLAARSSFAASGLPASRIAAAPPAMQAREIARTGAVTLLVPSVDGAIAGIARLVRRESGIVVQLSDDVPTKATAPHTAALTIRVPSDRFDATMEALPRLGTAKARSVRSDDLTGAIVDADARLRNLRREESDLLKIMDRSGKIPDVLDVERELATVRGEIEELAGQAHAMRDRVADSTIVIVLKDRRPGPPAAHVTKMPLAQLGAEWKRSLADVRNFTIRQAGRFFELIVFSPYFALLGALGYVIYRRVRRSRV